MRYTRPVLEGLASDPLYWLGGYARRFPGAWTQLADAHATLKPPPWVYAPLSAAQGVLSQSLADRAFEDLPWETRTEIATDAANLTALAAWRMSKGVYRYDPALERALWDTPVKGNIPTLVLRQLPEWCVYLAVSRDTEFGPLHGAWAHLDTRGGEETLRLVLSLGGELVPVVLVLGGTIQEGFDAWADKLDVSQAVAGLGANMLEFRRVNNVMRSLAEPLVSLLLYLCSAEPEISGNGRPGNPRPVRAKGGQKVIAVQGVRSWDVGVVLGAALRAAHERQEDSDRRAEGGERSVRPHIRRAHWHTYLTGPRGSEQTSVLKWLHPMLVNAPDPDDMPVVVRPVR